MAIDECPKAAITAESAALLEGFLAYRRLGFPRWAELAAREAHAYLILENEVRREAENERG